MAKVVYSQKLKPVLCYNGYCYHMHSFNGDKTRRYWRCVQRETCKARITTGQNLNDITIIRDGTANHQHTACAEERAEEIVLSLKRCAEEEPTITLLEELGENIDNIDSKEIISMVPHRNALSRGIDGRKKRNRPTNSARIEDIEIPMMLTVTSRGEPFLMHDSGVDDDKRVLIFGTDENLRYLSSSTTLVCDSMLATTSRQFAELFILFGVVFGCPVPLVYALTKTKREDAYKHIYERVVEFAREKNLKIRPSLCMMDFQLANVNAIREVFPNARIRGCLFSFAQLLWQRMSFLRLTSRYKWLDSNTRKCGSMLFALPFVPLEDVSETFEYIAEIAEEALDDLINCFERLFVHGRRGRGERQPEPPKFPPETWNVYTSVLSDEHGTDIGLEGWHEKFQTLLEVYQNSIWRLVEALKDEQQNSEQAIAQMHGTHAKKWPSTAAQYRQRQIHIRKLVIKYVNYKAKGQVDLYLTEVARLLVDSRVTLSLGDYEKQIIQ
ncbi:FLYWCH zinc finger domain protein [Trichuris suis]|nr:FLYWCH zinc finger domain protein [Trichuris suis]